MGIAMNTVTGSRPGKLGVSVGRFHRSHVECNASTWHRHNQAIAPRIPHMAYAVGRASLDNYAQSGESKRDMGERDRLFWALFLAMDYLRHQRRRSLGEIASKVGVSKNVLQQKVKHADPPPTTSVFALARQAGMPLDIADAIYRRQGLVIIDLGTGDISLSQERRAS